ncbi:MAG: hypothetical protein ACRDRJ_34380 [Streptosporangiaceae bacterium]
MIINVPCRQPEPRLPANRYMENQLTGSPPTFYPKYQGDADFTVVMVDEPPPYQPPRPVPARSWHPAGADPLGDVELIEEDQAWSPPPGLDDGADEEDFFHSKSEGKKKRHRGSRRGARNPNAKLDSTTVLAIRREFERGASIRKLAKIYERSRGTIANIVTGESWQDVGQEGEHYEEL